MGSYLDDLLLAAARRVKADEARVPLDVVQQAAAVAATPRSFRQALSTRDVAVIAEIKRASPSQGPIAPQLDAVAQARQYQAGGAAAISVLTEPQWFHGSLDDLVAVSELGTPTLRKEFIISAYQVFEARAAGAAAVLLIVAALEAKQLDDLYATARSVGLDVLVEVHDSDEATLAVSIGADIIGVNARDLKTFTLDPDGFQRVRQMLPDGVLAVAESGVRTPADVTRYATQGADAVLIGEQFMRAANPKEEVQLFVTAGRESETA